MNSYLLEILHIVFKRKILILGSFVVIFGSVAIGTLLRPPLYRASGRFMVTGQQSTLPLAPGETWRARQPDLKAINTEIETLKGGAFLGKVAKALPSFPETNGQKSFLARMAWVLPFSLAEKVGAATDGKGSTNGSNGSWPFDRSRLEVLSVPNSDLIEIGFTDSNPERAAAVINAVLEAYPAHIASLYRDPASLSFYDGQKQMLDRETAELDQEIKAYRAREGIVSLKEQKDTLFGLIDKVKDRLESTIADLDQGKGKIAEIERQMKDLPKFEVTAQDVIDPENRMLHEKLVALELEKNALLQKYTEKDRRVEDKVREIEAIKERLAAGAGKKVVVGERIGKNSVHLSLENELIEQKVKLAQSYAKRQTLAHQVQVLTKELEALNAKGYKLLHMEESLAKKKEVYFLYSKKAEDARITAAMDREQLVNVRVVDHSPVPTSPIAAGLMLSLVLAAIVGIGGGVGGALGLEYLRPTFHAALDAQRHLQLPVLALIPDLREKS